MDLSRDKTVAKIVARLTAGDGPVNVEGTWGSYARLLTAHIAETLARPILYISPHIDDADNAGYDLYTFTGRAVDSLPAWEGVEDLADATDEIRAERLRIVSRCAATRADGPSPGIAPIVSTPVQALCQPVPKTETIAERSLRLAVEAEISPEAVAEWLVDNGFERVDRIDLPGQFARRGGIVDIYAPMLAEAADDAESTDAAAPIRVEFFGDLIESIRRINLDTHRSRDSMAVATVISALCGSTADERQLLLDALPQETIIVFDEPGAIEEVVNVFLARLPDSTGLYDFGQIYNAAGRFTQLNLCRFAVSDARHIKVDVRSVQQFQHTAASAWAGHKAALEDLITQANNRRKVLLYCESPAEVTRVSEIVTEINGSIPRNFELPLGFVSQGFVIEPLDTIVLSHHELFGQFALRRKQRPTRHSAPIDTLSDLQSGDYVVHASYGIGKYLGIETIDEHDSKAEYLTIQYAGGARVQVSVRNIALVQKFIGTSPKRPQLSKIGTKKWRKQKEKVAASVEDMAEGLLRLQAERQALGGIEYGTDSNWQMEFEESFPYQETPDQITAAEQIKADMQQPIAMDRLLCGDVGYGKTELAMRAAFKAVENGKQVAVLVPTTVLCVQHGRTFTERFADFPVTIEILNRFKSPKQACDIVARTRAGLVDILIGTHRLLSKDVDFKDLGLLIIDEEQRFGVEHKERLKRLRVNVDILTMTATPIPRTLHMSMLGLRDISSLATAPLDRRSIVTSVNAYSDELIRKAVLRELNRAGQVFFLHNRVKSIERKAWQLQKLIPDARFRVAHGQMAKSELEKAMIDFVLGDVDVLVCTTIIESGLDIPNANTIIVDNADRFGLAELHQLRGRVGRYKHRAYAHLLLPASRSITPIAAKRLKAIEEYSHLGAGFRIALRDLEIRGAGNILGAAQSGHIQTVGYQMYCELLSNAVRRLKGQPVEEIPKAVIDLGFASYIPRDYIPVDRQRLDIYRKIAVATGPDDLAQIQAELNDVYGPTGDDVELLLQTADIRIKASRKGLKSIVASPPEIVFSFGEDADAGDLFARVEKRIRTPDPKTVCMRLSENYFEPRTLLSLLRKMFEGSS